MIVISTLRTRMQNGQDESLNNIPNRGILWMIGSKSNKEEQFFNFQIQKTVTLFSRRFQFSVGLTGTKSKEKANVRNDYLH
jgi:hypothetical protein